MLKFSIFSMILGKVTKINKHNSILQTYIYLICTMVKNANFKIDGSFFFGLIVDETLFQYKKDDKFFT
jgi:hypothetical protein